MLPRVFFSFYDLDAGYAGPQRANATPRLGASVPGCPGSGCELIQVGPLMSSDCHSLTRTSTLPLMSSHGLAQVDPAAVGVQTAPGTELANFDDWEAALPPDIIRCFWGTLTASDGF